MSEHAARSCNGKKRIKSERKAESIAAATQTRSGIPMKAYPCNFCKGFHVGSIEVHDPEYSRTSIAVRKEKFGSKRDRAEKRAFRKIL